MCDLSSDEEEGEECCTSEQQKKSEMMWQKRVKDLEEEQASLRIKLEHRGSQVEELQNEMSAQAKELSHAQKEVSRFFKLARDRGSQY